MKYKEPATWRDTRDEAIELEPLTPEHTEAVAEYRRLREEQLGRALAQLNMEGEQ